MLLLSIVMLSATSGVVYQARDLLYIQVGVAMQGQRPPGDFNDKMGKVIKLQNAFSMLVWATIFLVKFSFLVFFKRLVSRIKSLEIWWWTVFAIVACCGLVCIPLGWYICTDTNAETLFRKLKRNCILGGLPLTILCLQKTALYLI